MSKKSPSFPKMNKCDVTARTMPHFTLLACDNFTPIMIRQWIDFAVAHGTPAAKINEAQRILAHIEEWRRENPTKCKTPD